MIDCLRDQPDPTGSSPKASPGNQETRRRDQLVGPKAINHGIPYNPPTSS